jgi:hypothetical protein
MNLWYAAHILMYVKRKNHASGKIPVWENIVLIKADSEDLAFAKAQERGKQDEGDDDGTFLWAGQPAEWVFAGVRKLTLCEDPEKRSGDGSEISYTEIEVNSEPALADLLEGKPVAVKVIELSNEPRSQNTEPAVEKQRA